MTEDRLDDLPSLAQKALDEQPEDRLKPMLRL